jgi:hypothetical protein
MIVKTSNLKPTDGVVLLLAFIAGLVIGLVLNDIPGLTLKKEVDVGAIVAVVSLFLATVIVPLKINAHVSNVRNKNSIIIRDLNEILDQLNRIKTLHSDVFYANTVIKLREQRAMLALFKDASNRIDSLAKQLCDLPNFKDFKDNISIPFSRDLKPAYTDKFIKTKKIREQDYLTATGEMNKIVTELKECRYKTYA